MSVINGSTMESQAEGSKTSTANIPGTTNIPGTESQPEHSKTSTVNGASIESQAEGSKTSTANGPKTGLTDVLSKQPPFQKLTSSEKEELMAKLYDDDKDIKLKFASLVTRTCNSVEKRIPVVKLARSILALGAYEPAPEKQDRSLLDEHKEEIIRAQTISHIFVILDAYWNYLTYEILQYIIDHFGDDTDKERLKSYNQDLQEFCERRSFELPSESSNDNVVNPKQEKFTVKLNFREDSTCKDLLLIRGKIAKILRVNLAALCLTHLEKGCVQLTFLIPRFVAQKLFPLSCEQTSALSKDASVVRLECGHYVFEVGVITVR